MPKKQGKTLTEELQAIDELVAYFNADDFDLDQGVEKYDQLADRVKSVFKKLENYSLKIEKRRTELEALLEKSL